MKKILPPLRIKRSKEHSLSSGQSTDSKIDSELKKRIILQTENHVEVDIDKRIKKLENYIEQQEPEIHQLSLSILLKEKEIN